MKTIGARLTAWYAFSATLTLFVLFLIGYQLLEQRLTHGLDQLNFAEFEQIRAHLGPDYKSIDRATMDRRIRETSEFSSVLFYIVVDHPKGGIYFRSSNLHGGDIPDVKGRRQYSTPAPVGDLRVSEFLMPPFDVTIATSLLPVREGLRSYVEVCAALMIGMLLASIAVGFGVSHVMLRPIRLIRETANRIRSDNLSERIPVSEVRDELTDLIRLLNQMFDRLETAFVQVRRFADEASHELKTPLSLVRLHAEKMLTDGDLPAEQTDAVLVQLEEIARLNQIIDELLFLSRAEADAIPFQLKVQSPAALIDGFRPDALALTGHHGLSFTCSHEGEVAVDYEEKWLRQVLLNLLTNALRVSPPGGEIRLKSQVADGLWSVAVEDQGPGLAPEQLQRIFERFVRFNVPENAGKGSGLGLTICEAIIAKHGGRIYAENRSMGHGLRVVFEIPTAAAA
ncbi:sensor histidine kinase [Phenylobacterium montanum]|uniref:histidine kinase n=1 Tax=Phenylobacterium montanum TaxID=2823693 RepID=A0A975IW12_9CAUL|nr:ATP-binding protein [Caulobacter sp. S6]QUD89597.1 HAMP domain-containing protein [Caulobacter sp. S6]